MIWAVDGLPRTISCPGSFADRSARTRYRSRISSAGRPAIRAMSSVTEPEEAATPCASAAHLPAILAAIDAAGQKKEKAPLEGAAVLPAIRAVIDAPEQNKEKASLAGTAALPAVPIRTARPALAITAVINGMTTRFSSSEKSGNVPFIHRQTGRVPRGTARIFRTLPGRAGMRIPIDKTAAKVNRKPVCRK